MANDLGVRQNYISNLECGRRVPGPMFRKFLALYFGVPVEIVAGWFANQERRAA